MPRTFEETRAYLLSRPFPLSHRRTLSLFCARGDGVWSTPRVGDKSKMEFGGAAVDARVHTI